MNNEQLINRYMNPITMQTGISANEQESSYMNGTLQTVGDGLAMTIHTYLSVPKGVAAQGQQAVAAYVEAKLNAAHIACPAFSFEVEIGPDES
jgi:hypothetical protein